MTNQSDEMPDWIKKRNAEKAEQKRQDEESLRGQQQALASIGAGVPEFWKRFTDRVVVNARAFSNSTERNFSVSPPCLRPSLCLRPSPNTTAISHGPEASNFAVD